MRLAPDFKLMLEILAAVAAGIVLALSYTDDMFFIHPFIQEVFFYGAGFWVVDCIYPMPKDVRIKRPHPRPRQAAFAAILL